MIEIELNHPFEILGVLLSKLGKHMTPPRQGSAATGGRKLFTLLPSTFICGVNLD